MKNQDQLLREAVFKFVLIIVCLTLFIFSATSKADSIILGGKSYHATQPKCDLEGNCPRYNEENYALGYSLDEVNGTLIYFKNSYGDPAMFIGRYLDIINSEIYQLRVHGGVVGGYDRGPFIGVIIENSFRLNKYFEPSIMVFGEAIAFGLRINF